MSQPDVSPTSFSNNDDINDITFAKRGCCFWIPFLNSEPAAPPCGGSGFGSFFWQRIKPVDSSPNTPPTAATATTNDGVQTAGSTAPAKEEPWWTRGWKKVREWSEIVAGPRWKTLLRRIGKRRNSRPQQVFGKFQYDPLSYSLNFDDGPEHNGKFDEDLLGRGFSSRYSLPPSSKSSMDFDKEFVSFA